VEDYSWQCHRLWGIRPIPHFFLDATIDRENQTLEVKVHVLEEEEEEIWEPLEVPISPMETTTILPWDPKTLQPQVTWLIPVAK
jgi:hypothetical protein